MLCICVRQVPPQATGHTSVPRASRKWPHRNETSQERLDREFGEQEAQQLAQWQWEQEQQAMQLHAQPVHAPQQQQFMPAGSTTPVLPPQRPAAFCKSSQDCRVTTAEPMQTAAEMHQGMQQQGYDGQSRTGQDFSLQNRSYNGHAGHLLPRDTQAPTLNRRNASLPHGHYGANGFSSPSVPDRSRPALVDGEAQRERTNLAQGRFPPPQSPTHLQGPGGGKNGGPGGGGSSRGGREGNGYR